MPRSLLLVLTLAACGAGYSRALPERGPVGGEVAAFADGEVDQRTRGVAVDPVVIRTADVGVSVDAYEPFRDELLQWLGTNGGRISDESLTRSDGRASWANLVLRVPASELDPLLAWLQEGYGVDRMQVSSQDVTAEWVDLEARLAAMRTTESRLLGLVADRTATLADVLAAESELARVRGEIESMEGRRRVLDDQASYATVRLGVGVRAPFVGGVSEPLLGEAARAFHASLGAMATVGRGSVVALAALAPWLAVLGLGVATAAAGLRTAWRRAVAAA